LGSGERVGERFAGELLPPDPLFIGENRQRPLQPLGADVPYHLLVIGRGEAERPAGDTDRRGGGRRQLRCRRSRPVSDGACEELVAAVHEEVQRLPEAERAALVLCDLQGVSQPDAAVRLGWPLGSVSGRLCKARQRLLNRLAARGVAPAVVVGVGITAAGAGAVPAGVFETVRTFSASPVAASSAAAAPARGFTEGVTMRVKVTAAVTIAALGLTGGAVLLSAVKKLIELMTCRRRRFRRRRGTRITSSGWRVRPVDPAFRFVRRAQGSRVRGGAKTTSTSAFRRTAGPKIRWPFCRSCFREPSSRPTCGPIR
jgi:hypothetical protein